MTDNEQELIKTLNKNLNIKNTIDLKRLQVDGLLKNDLKYPEQEYLKEKIRFFRHGANLIIILEISVILLTLYLTLSFFNLT